ncbi:hypothetical protein N9C35_02140 [Flavobacteriaceae bacterium]|nr:hypothetical protein [Flavobacteriaceae bacterium]
MINEMNWKDYITIVASLISIVGAVVAWVRSIIISRDLRKREYNIQIDKLSDNFEEFKCSSIQYWCNCDLKNGERNVLESSILSKHKDISLQITRLDKNFKEFFTGTADIISELNCLNTEITGNTFGEPNFKINTNKAKLINSGAHTLKRIINDKYIKI